VFVGTPSGKTVFVGMYGVHYKGINQQDFPLPTRDEVDKAGSCDEYKLTLKREPSALADLIGKLYVDWGQGREKGRGGEIAWVQRADRHDKPITELRTEEEEHPGRVY